MVAVAEKTGWPYKLLDPKAHARLVADIEDTAHIAGVPVDMLDRTMKDCGCSETEREWVKNFHAIRLTPKKGGLLLVGKFKPTPEIRLQAMGAAFLRNYIDARLVGLSSLLPVDNEVPDLNPTVLLIPDFCRVSGGKQGHALTHWQSRFIHSFLLERFTQRRVTVMHVDDLPSIEKEYGKSFLDFIAENWTVHKVG